MNFEKIKKAQDLIKGEYESAWEWLNQREKDFTNSSKSEKEMQRCISNMNSDIEDYFRTVDGMREMFRLFGDEKEQKIINKTAENYGLSLREKANLILDFIRG